jgi:hypothetical protein
MSVIPVALESVVPWTTLLGLYSLHQGVCYRKLEPCRPAASKEERYKVLLVTLDAFVVRCCRSPRGFHGTLSQQQQLEPRA